ncbi:MAG TPA: condensation domain-containing protein, partial [Pyrinomonadaceae bacterium]|nr:condensation domain-containing protein [Pyrinomonadaceae bacterium]
MTTNRPVELPELPVQYADFAEWQREWLQGDVFDEQLNYWMRNLAGAPPELKFPTDRPRLPQQSFRGGSVSVKLSPELSKAIRDFSQREGVTVFMTMLAAFQTLLFRYTSQADIVVGSPIAGRNRIEIENLIGFFVNTLALRTNFSGNPSFRELVERVKEVTLGAYAHQDLPFEELVRELNPERDANHSPVFQVMFGMQNEAPPPLTLHGLTISRVPVATRTAKFDLTLYASQTETHLVCWLEYSLDLFEEATIKRMLGHLESLLQAVVAEPDQRVSDLAFLTEAEREQLLAWNHTTTDYPTNACVHELCEGQVQRTPKNVAVVFDDEQLTYEQLNARANQLAHYLQKRGVGPGSLVCICLERSTAMIVAMLGILKAGAA